MPAPSPDASSVPTGSSPSSSSLPELDLAPIEALVARAFGAQPGPVAWEPMPGGASTRRYFRRRLSNAGAGAGGARVTSMVGMFVPDGAKAEEIDKAGAPPARWPFLEIRDLLASRGVDVPLVYAEDTGRGWVLLEDLGDDTLAVFLAAHPDRKESLYVRAVNDLARAQQALANLADGSVGSVVAGRAFDEDLLLWEIQHFREWGLDARGIALSADDRAAFDGIALRLARRIAAGPRVFVHRDYQSRNLMVRRGVRRGEGDPASGAWRSLAWIDFQDALLGPRVYDLVALLNDSYQTFDRAFVEAPSTSMQARRGSTPPRGASSVGSSIA
jgi:aminoglycoside/choline kinase family phosphotransferase